MIRPIAVRPPVNKLIIAALVLVVSSMQLAAAAAPAQTRAGEILATVEELGDKTPRGLFDELGQLGTAQAFMALERSVGELKNEWSKRAAFKAFRHFLDDPELGPKAIATTKRYARGGDAKDARAAAGALADFGPRAYDALYEVARGGRDDQARASALRGVLPDLAERSDMAALELVLDGEPCHLGEGASTTHGVHTTEYRNASPDGPCRFLVLVDTSRC